MPLMLLAHASVCTAEKENSGFSAAMVTLCDSADFFSLLSSISKLISALKGFASSYTSEASFSATPVRSMYASLCPCITPLQSKPLSFRSSATFSSTVTKSISAGTPILSRYSEFMCRIQCLIPASATMSIFSDSGVSPASTTSITSESPKPLKVILGASFGSIDCGISTSFSTSSTESSTFILRLSDPSPSLVSTWNVTKSFGEYSSGSEA